MEVIMDFLYSELLSPYQLTENIALKNRIISPNVIRGHSQGPETWPAEPQFADCTGICTSGAAMFSYRHYGKFGGGANPKRGNGDPRAAFDYNDPSIANYLQQLAAQIHMLGSKVLIKLEQEFPNGMTLHGGVAEFLYPAPKGFKARMPRGMKIMTREEMMANCCPKELFPEVIEEMVDFMRRYVEWGFDGMSLRCDRYIDASINLRTDEYNGEIENRARFTYELFRRMKEVFGSDFIIEGAMPGAQPHGELGAIPHGYTLDETVRFAKMMEGVVDVLQIRNENMIHYHATGYDSVRHDHESLKFCRAIKEAGVKMVLAANSGFVEPEDMEAALESGDCDLISVGRELIAEPEFTKKLFINEKPTPCIQCNNCHGMMNDRNIPFCSVNPTSGITHRLHYTFRSTGRLKKVAVIGGGLIGMRAACMAAEQGHTVTLYEKTGYLGGKAKFADVYDFKWPIQRYREWLVGELDRKGIDVRLNCEPAPEEIRAAGYDAVIACTGSVAKRPGVSGAESDEIYTSEDIYESRVLPEQLGKHIAVIGGSSVATETAMYLAQQGKAITIICRQNKLAIDMENPHDGLHDTFIKIDPEQGYGGTIPYWGIFNDFNVILKAKTIAVAPKNVTYVGEDGREVAVECDNVIVNGGFRHCHKEAFVYAGCAPEFYMAGDVEDCCGNIQQGNVSAFGKVNML